MALNEIERRLLERTADAAEKAHTVAAETAVAVKTVASQTKELFDRVRKTENDMVEMKTNYTNCGARKSYEAGTLPGNKSERQAAFWGMFAAVVAVSAVIGSLLSPLARIVIDKIFGG